MKNKRSEVEETSDRNEKIEREMKKEGRERNEKRGGERDREMKKE
jgi:hypothetical protein